MNNYFLRSRRLGFRPWSRDDIGLAMHLWGDPRVTQFLGGPLTEGQVQTGLEKEILLQTSHGIQYWPTFCLADGAHVGCCGLRPYRPEVLIIEIGFLVFDDSPRIRALDRVMTRLTVYVIDPGTECESDV